MARQNAGIRSSSTWIKVLAIGVLVALTVALSVLVISKAGKTVEGAGGTPGYNPAQQSEEPQSSGIPEEPAEDADGDEEVVVTVQPVAELNRVMVALGGDTVLRGLTGPCPTVEAVVETSFDAGATWTGDNLGATLPMVSLNRLVDIGDGLVGALGYNAQECSQLSAGSSVVGTTTWLPLETENLWRVDPAQPTVLLGAGGIAVDAGCTIARQSVGAEGPMAVLCEDGALRVSTDNGANWVGDEGTLAAAGGTPDSVVVGGTNVFVASVNAPDCDGAVLTSYGTGVDGLQMTQTACVSGAQGASGATVTAMGGGQTSLAFAPDGGLWLWGGDALVRSYDGGLSWG
ncbi:hypothetical protein [Actinomyces minihominis]|uniref:hypothetical protein n=1 Tax=Actinomyces minihominis TaxID=2002838 RepID=UPI000C06C9F0|nr:hypothetical protein [Actinomyces minihominis]